MAVLSLVIIGGLFVIFIVVKAEANRKKLEYRDLRKPIEQSNNSHNLLGKNSGEAIESQIESEVVTNPTESEVVANPRGSQENPETSSQDILWYYAEENKRKGPYAYNDFLKFIAEGVVKRDTLIWHGSGDWIAAKDTELSKFFTSPPPLPGSNVSNRLPWLIVLVPIVGSIVEMLTGVDASTGIEVILAYVAVNTLLCIWDESRLKKAGHDAPSIWWIFLIPVYLWKRAKKLNQKRSYFWAWIFMCILSLFVPYSEAAIPQAAIPVVNQILQESDSSAKCVSIQIESKTLDDVFGIYGVYKGKAILDNGNELTISVEDIGYTVRVQVNLLGY